MRLKPCFSFLLALLFLSIPPAWSGIPQEGSQQDAIRIHLLVDENAPSGFTIELDEEKLSGLDALKARLESSGKDRKIRIDPGSKVQYAQVVQVVNVCLKAGHTRIVFGAMPSRLEEDVAYRIRLLANPLDGSAAQDHAERLEETVSRLKLRLDGLGLSSAEVQVTAKNRIQVDLPPVPEGLAGKRILRLLQAQGKLEFLVTVDDEIILAEKREELIRYLERLEAEQGGWDRSTDLSSLRFSATQGERPARYRWVANSSGPLYEEAPKDPVQPLKTFKGLGLEVHRKPEAIHAYFELVKEYDDARWRFTTDDLEKVAPGKDEMRNPAVRFSFRSVRQDDFRDFTRNHINERLAMVFEGRILCNPVINSEIPGEGIISGPQPRGFTREEQKLLIATLGSGRLRMALEILSIEIRNR